VSARLEGKDAGTASMLKVRASLALEDLDPQRTRVTYHAEVAVLGKLGSYGWSLMHRNAEEHMTAFGEAVVVQLCIRC